MLAVLSVLGAYLDTDAVVNIIEFVPTQVCVITAFFECARQMTDLFVYYYYYYYYYY